MKYRFLFLVCGLVLVLSFSSDVFAAQSVVIVKSQPVYPGEAAYRVTVDFGGADDYDAHFIVGQKYAEAVLDAFKEQGGFEKAVSACLRESVVGMERNGLRFKEMMTRVKRIMGKNSIDGDETSLAKAEIEGMDSVLNSSRNGYSARDRLWLLMFKENQLTLRELYLLNLISNPSDGQFAAHGAVIPAQHRQKPSGLDGLKAVYILKNRGDKPDQIREGFLGCLFNAVCVPGQNAMISGVETEFAETVNR